MIAEKLKSDLEVPFRSSVLKISDLCVTLFGQTEIYEKQIVYVNIMPYLAVGNPVVAVVM